MPPPLSPLQRLQTCELDQLSPLRIVCVLFREGGSVRPPEEKKRNRDIASAAAAAAPTHVFHPVSAADSPSDSGGFTLSLWKKFSLFPRVKSAREKRASFTQKPVWRCFLRSCGDMWHWREK